MKLSYKILILCSFVFLIACSVSNLVYADPVAGPCGEKVIGFLKNLNTVEAEKVIEEITTAGGVDAWNEQQCVRGNMLKVWSEEPDPKRDPALVCLPNNSATDHKEPPFNEVKTKRELASVKTDLAKAPGLEEVVGDTNLNPPGASEDRLTSNIFHQLPNITFVEVKRESDHKNRVGFMKSPTACVPDDADPVNCVNP